jgi:NADPH2 dehydrogenase
LSEFLSPLNNQRCDKYGLTLENRCLLIIEISERFVKEVKLPLIVRISSDEWIDGGWSLEDSIYLSKALKDVGVEMINVSAGGHHPKYTKMPTIAPLYMSEYSKEIRQKANIPTIAVGLITTASEGESLLLGDVCDLVGYGRLLLRSPNFALQAAKILKDDDVIPFSYQRAF